MTKRLKKKNLMSGGTAPLNLIAFVIPDIHSKKWGIGVGVTIPMKGP